MPDPKPTRSILTEGQRRLHAVLLAMSLYTLANAAFLWITSGQLVEGRVLPAFYQWMLVSHVVVGTLLIAPMVIFVFWHLRRALAMHNPKAVWTGVFVTFCAFALLATGLFMFSRSNAAANAWAFIGHRVLAIAAPAGYVVHRYLARHKPATSAVRLGVFAPLAFLCISLGIHYATLPDPRPEPQHFVKQPKPGEDPFKQDFPDYGVSGVPSTSPFFPAATRSGTGGFLRPGLLTNDDLATNDVLEKDIADAGFSVNAKIGSETCARCHADIVDQWSKSAHRFSSFNNPFYRAAVEALRNEDDGKTRSQWCAGCHDPAIMMAGNWMKDIEPTIAESQAGLTCLACHLMDEVHGVGGNGNYKINDAAPSPYLFDQAKGGTLAEVRDLLIKSKPDVHKADMLKPVFRTSEYCGTCHKVSLDTPVNRYRWIRGQNEYDNHQDSGVTHSNARTWYLPPVTKTCQDCHMPLVDAPKGDVSAKNGKVKSHLFIGPNTALPHIRGDKETIAQIEAFLKEAKMRVDVFAVKQGDRLAEAPDARPIAITAGEPAEIQVVVRNQGVGHTFPGGTLDSNESWIHFTVSEAAAAGAPSKPLFESGGIDPETKRIDRDAHFYRVLFVDEQGREADRRNPHDFRAAVHLKVIGPSTSDVVRYSMTVPPELAGRKLAVKATLRWRKFSPDYTAFSWKATMKGRTPPELPITDIASSTATFDVVAPGTVVPAAPVDAARVNKEWQRWNDWGVACAIQGDTRGAERAFKVVRDADPKRPDGWRNLARAKLIDGAAAPALELLTQADAVDPGNAQTAFFLGQALERLGQYDEALQQYGIAAQRFPNDRTNHQTVAGILYRLERYDEALLAALRVLAIDPEDRTAHKLRMEIYGAKAAEEKDAAKRAELEAAQSVAAKAVAKFSVDESAQKWTNEFRRARPDVNLESLPIHIHELRRIP